MPNENRTGEYRANDADQLVGEIFSGRVTVADAIESLRTRLLDLSFRNRLLAYGHPKGRCIQICNEPNIDLIFARLFIDGKGVLFKHVPEPDPHTYEGRKPEARLYASTLGIDTSFEFSPNRSGSSGRRLHGIQTLLYPAELERRLRKIASEAKTAIEETGTNMLYLVFGFLEFFDSENSDRALLAPLISLPATLVRGDVDQETRTYHFSVVHNGEDLAENHTLREKLRRDFILNLPEFEENDEPEVYFTKIEQAIRTKRRWRVRRQITLGMFSFGKLAIWSDLDIKKNDQILENSLIKAVFTGGGSGGGGFYAEDYRIDDQPEASQTLIYDADSSQHSAIIDVLSGKNMVINGPPGTGKSQTITNVIAAALSKGKKVLFVSEKLAALEVVRHRLNQANLGYFCLELHSHKTQKKKFLEDIQARIDQEFRVPALFQSKLATLQRQKLELARHAEIMGSRVGNKLGMTVYEIFWAAERRRQELGDISTVVNAIKFSNALNWTYDDIDFRRSRLASLAGLYDAIGSFDSSHPWWGFRPNPLAPSDDEDIDRIIEKALFLAHAADKAAKLAVDWFGLEGQPTAEEAAAIAATFKITPDFPDRGDTFLLARMFHPIIDPNGEKSSEVLSSITAGVEKARSFFAAASEDLSEGNRLIPEEIDQIDKLVSRHKISQSLMMVDIAEAKANVDLFAKAIEAFEQATKVSNAHYGEAGVTSCADFIQLCSEINRFCLGPVVISLVADKAKALKEVVTKLMLSLGRVSQIVERRGLAFDSSPEAVARLANPDSIQGLKVNAAIDQHSINKARSFAASPLADRSVSDIERLRAYLNEEIAACSEALSRCKAACERLGVDFDSSERAVGELAALVAVAVVAPSDLLEYRMSTFGQARTTELISRIASFLKSETTTRESLASIFYLDALPTPSEIMTSVAALRGKDGLFAFLNSDWRKARKLHVGLSREKRKISAKSRAEELVKLGAWIEDQGVFVSDVELKECFGRLFRGLETDPKKLERLNEWYTLSRSNLVACPGLLERFDLTSTPAHRLLELAAESGSLRADIERLAALDGEIRKMFGGGIAGFREARETSWPDGLEYLRCVSERLGSVVEFFSTRTEKNLSPKEALSLLEAKIELIGATDDLTFLMRGKEALRETAGDELAKILNLAEGPWSQSLSFLTMAISKVLEAVSQASTFACCDVPFSVAEAFAEAKLRMDEYWADVASLPEWNHFRDWSSLIAVAREDSLAAADVLGRLSTCAKTGVSASSVLNAFGRESEAQQILDKLAYSNEVRSLLGDLLEGVTTDIGSLSSTHAWGLTVNNLDFPADIRRRLLSSDAREALETGRKLFSEVDYSCREAKFVLEKLRSYGSFSWEYWNKGGGEKFTSYKPSAILSRIEEAAKPGLILPWSKYIMIRQQAKQEGLEEFVSALESRKVPAANLPLAFEFAAYQSIGRSIYQAYPELPKFNGATHEKIRADFRSLDAEIIALTGKVFASQIERNTRVPEGQRGTTVGEYTEMNLLRKEINKQRRHIPIRQLIKRAGAALLELKPCFMMGPLSVAQYLEPGALKFDMVVMDEASQLRPEEALGAIARGTQLVVVGDPKQLPPTNFFNRMVDSGDEDENDDAPAATTGMESILDICQQLFTPVRSLRWHYRSHHESLIAFSNHHFYKNLIVFPSPYSKKSGLGVKYRYVKSGFYKDRRNVSEAQILVDAVLEHMIKRPEESLGVVTLNQTQRELIEELLDNKLKNFVEGAKFLGRWEEEGWPFFVKNLENVQGDERDVIFISTTFGKAPGTNKVRHNFGPISRPDGWRRLNVLFTRAKRRIELFTSLTPGDFVIDEKTPIGTKALRDYLDFAKRGVLVTTDENEREPDSDFEISVANVVTSLGYEVKPQLGVAGFFIDLAVRNPDRPGEFLAGIECDGATYHSGFSVRDRDRIRQEILESLGWKGRIHRIWSTDWFYDPRKEIARLQDFLEERRRTSAEEEFEEEKEEVIQDEVTEAAAEGVEPVESVAEVSDTEDVFVEVGDRITFCFVDTPEVRHKVAIVDGESNLSTGVINEQTPVAQVLIGMAPGELGNLVVPGKPLRQLRVLKIHRQEELIT